VNSQPQSHKRPAFIDDIVNEEFGDEGEGLRRNSIIQHHLKRKDKGELPKKKKPRKPKTANGHLSVLDQIEALEHQENEDLSPERRNNFAAFDFKKEQLKSLDSDTLNERYNATQNRKESINHEADFIEAIRDFDDTGL
jgi:hypothetical protein